MFAIAFGVFLICAETCRHIEDALALPRDWLSLPFHDWIAGSLLVYAGVLSRRDWNGGRCFQAVAWGFMLSLLVGSFFAHLEEWSSQPKTSGWISEGALMGILAALLVLALGGLIGTLATFSASRSSFQGSVGR